MKIQKWFFISLAGVLLIGFLLGSFFDLQINQALYSRNNGFGLTLAAFGEAPSFMALVVMGTGFLLLGKSYRKTYQRVIFIVLFILTFAISTYFIGSHIFNTNGYNNSKLNFAGYLIGFALSLLAAVLGYLLLNKTSLSPRRLLYVLILLSFIYGVSIGINQLAKMIMSRPRFRFLKEMDVIQEYYRNWWQNGKDVRNLYLKETILFPNGNPITKEEFKSFPSGHVNNAMFMPLFLGALPLFNNKIKVKSSLLTGIGLAYVALMMYSRMLVGAHFLSDVCFGGLITVVVAYLLSLIFNHFYNQIEEDNLQEDIEVSPKEIKEEVEKLEKAE